MAALIRASFFRFRLIVHPVSLADNPDSSQLRHSMVRAWATLSSDCGHSTIWEIVALSSEEVGIDRPKADPHLQGAGERAKAAAEKLERLGIADQTGKRVRTDMKTWCA